MTFERVLSFIGVALARENAALRKRNDDLKASLDSAVLQLLAKESAVEKMEDEIGMWRAKVRRLESDLTVRDAQIEDLTAGVDAMKFQLVEASGALEESNSQIALLQQQVRDFETDKQLDLIQPPTDNTAPEDAADIQINDVVQDTVCRLVGPWFDGGKHFWTFALGTIRFTARVSDKAFLDRLGRREVFFTAGDAVRMQLRAITFRTPTGGVYAKFFVEKIVGVIPPDQQTQFEPPALPIGAPATGVTQ
jgi:hypothetical protein